MSTVGRIFIVLNLVLAFVLLGFVGSWLYNVDTYRGAYDSLRRSGEPQLEQYRRDNEGLRNELTQVKTENESLRTALAQCSLRANEVQRAYIAEKSAQTNVEEKFVDFGGKIDKWDQIWTSYTAKVDEYNNEIDELQKKQLQLAESERLAHQREVTAAAFQLRAEAEKAALTQQIRNLQEQITDLNDRLAIAQAVYGGPIGAGAPPVDLVGRVTNVAADGRVMTVDFAGLAQGQPIQVGWRFALFSDTEFKGFVTVIEAFEIGTASCRLDTPQPGAASPAPGDRVRAVTFS